jgi:hypothetical protein
MSWEFHCWHCSSTVAFRSRPGNVFEKYILAIIRMRPVRCARCLKRQYRFVYVPARPRHDSQP